MTEQNQAERIHNLLIYNKSHGLMPYLLMFNFNEKQARHDKFDVIPYPSGSLALRAYIWAKKISKDTIIDPYTGKSLSRAAVALITYLLYELGRITDDMFEEVIPGKYILTDTQMLHDMIVELLGNTDVLELLESASTRNQEEHKQEIEAKKAKKSNRKK